MSKAAWCAALAVLLGAGGPGNAAERCARVVDAGTGEAIGGAWVKAAPSGAPEHQTYTDSAGSFCIGGLPAGPCAVEFTRLGFATLRAVLPESGIPVFALTPQPLQLQGLTVAARRPDEEPTAAFVETIPIDQTRPQPLPHLLERAAGVQVRQQGGLGSFSTASIRGSTAEQVLVLLDGVPLNQALGGGVDLGRLLSGGVERVEVYRGAVPARFGGNSLGGAVNLRTRPPSARPVAALQGMAGSFGTWQASAVLSGPWKGGQYLGLIEGTGSANDFSFHDDNGTPYNLADDERAVRANSDFASLRSLVKAERPWGGLRVRANHTLDLRHQGIPGIGNYQARRVRFDSWQSLGQVAISGSRRAHTSYELSLYHSLAQDTYKDPAGEVGTGVQHHRNATQGTGIQAVANLLAGSGTATLTGRARVEGFAPHDLRRPGSQLPSSRRNSALAGAEGEWGRGPILLVAGAQVEVLHDQRARSSGLVSIEGQAFRRRAVLAGGKVGGEWHLGQAWSLQAHLGRYQRPPSFYELFGDRGAAIGNTDLRHERGVQMDAGLSFATPQTRNLRRVELAFYRKQTRDLIRFVQNSQQISRPYNIGRALVQGIELRGEGHLGRLLLAGNYTYQVAQNRSPFPFENGRDLPNAPRHSLNLRSEVPCGRVSFFHEMNGESRQFLDRANRLFVAGRLLHTLGLSFGYLGVEATAELRNLTGIQAEDLWGYPLPGRAFFLSLSKNVGAATPRTQPTQPQE